MLSENVYAIDARVKTVGKSEVQDAKTSPEGNERLRSVLCERVQPAPCTTGENERKSFCSYLIVQLHATLPFKKERGRIVPKEALQDDP
jgi:hypothetical protein